VIIFLGRHSVHAMEITCYMGLHGVLPPGSDDFPAILDPDKADIRFSDLRGCKANLTWVVITSQDSLPHQRRSFYLRNNQAESWRPQVRLRRPARQ